MTQQIQKPIFSILAALAVLGVCVFGMVSVVQADTSRPKREYVETTTTALITDTAINDACVADAWDDETPTCASFLKKVQGYHQVELYIKFVRGGTATDVQMQCEGSIDGLKPWAKIQSGDASLAPLIEMGNRTYHWDVSAYGVTLDDTEVWRVSLEVNDHTLRCRLWATGGTADDKVTAWITLGAP